ncbi:MAG: DNA-binding protein WhiA [Thermoleophilia bacterium]
MSSFSRAVRDELSHRDPARDCCLLAEVSALVRTAGVFHIRGGEESERYALHLATPVQAAARIVYSFFKSLGAEGRLMTTREQRFRRRLVYQVHLNGSPAALQGMNELGILSDSFRIEPGIPRRIVRRRCCKAAFIRGCLIGSGSVNPPQREAHLEVVTPHEAFAEDLESLLVGLGFNPGVYARRGVHVVYLKGREQVAELLALAGAQEAALEVAEQAVMKEVRAQANRLANCDQANWGRTSAAATEQLAAIDFLTESGLLNSLPPALRAAADLRRENPYSTLSELADESEEGLSRSAVNHRLRRLVQTAREAGAPPPPGDCPSKWSGSG